MKRPDSEPETTAPDAPETAPESVTTPETPPPSNQFGDLAASLSRSINRKRRWRGKK